MATELELEDEFEAEAEDEFEGEDFLGGLAKGLGGLLGEGEFEDEFEGEEEFEYEDEFEGEEFLSRIASGVGGLLGEGEEEDEFEFEDEFEEEFEDEFEGEDFLGGLGGIVKGVSGLLGEGEFEDELEYEFEDELEFEDEAEAMFANLLKGAAGLLGEGEFEDEDEAEEFFGNLFRKALPVLKSIAKVAAPMVATAVGGPMLGKVAGELTSQLESEGESEEELEEELEYEDEAGLTLNQAISELLAARAARSGSAAEAEALVGASVMVALTPEDQRILGDVLPNIIRGAAVLTRVLYGRRGTRQGVRLVPSVVQRTTTGLSRRARRGRPISRRAAATHMATATRRVIGSPRRATRGLQRNVVGSRAARRINHRRALSAAGGVRYRPTRAGYGPGYRRAPSHRRVARVPGVRYTGARRPGVRYTGARRPGVVRGRPAGRYPVGVARRGAIRRPGAIRTVHVPPVGRVRGASHIRVATPVRLPATATRPARVVRVVTHVPVPKGARPAAKTAKVAVRTRAH
ncbi:MAG: hypothetical protein ACLPQS_09700 [Acidimicrobiales bacterium]